VCCLLSSVAHHCRDVLSLESIVVSVWHNLSRAAVNRLILSLTAFSLLFTLPRTRRSPSSFLLSPPPPLPILLLSCLFRGTRQSFSRSHFIHFIHFHLHPPHPDSSSLPCLGVILASNLSLVDLLASSSSFLYLIAVAGRCTGRNYPASCSVKSTRCTRGEAG